MTALAAPGAVTWIDVLKGGNYDPPNDNQAHAAGIDLVGDSSHAMLRAYRSGAGGSDSSTIYYFQALVGKNPGTISFYLGLDVTGDGLGDVFIEAKYFSTGSGTAPELHYHIADPSKAQTSPSTTGWVNSSTDANIELTLSSTDSYVARTVTAYDLDANGWPDYYITFGFTLSSLQAFASNALGVSVDGSSIKVLYGFTATSQTANGDIGGINDQTADLTASWPSLGSRIGEYLDTVSTVGLVSSGPVTGTIDISTATDSGSNDTATNNALPALTFTGDSGLTITLKGPGGSTLAAGQYSVSFDAGTRSC